MAGPPSQRHGGTKSRSALQGCKGCCSICMMALGVFMIIPGGALTGVGFAVKGLDNGDDMKIIGLIVLGGGSVMMLLGCCLCCELCNKSAQEGRVIRHRESERPNQSAQVVTGYTAQTGATPTASGYVAMGANTSYPATAPQPLGTGGTLYREQIHTAPYNPNYPAACMPGQVQPSPYAPQILPGCGPGYGPTQSGQPLGGYFPQQPLGYSSQPVGGSGSQSTLTNTTCNPATHLEVVPPASGVAIPTAPPLNPEAPPSYDEVMNS